MKYESDAHDVASNMNHGTLKSYVIGFVLSIILTLVAYYFVLYRILLGWPLAFTLCGFGILQALVQLIFFIHLDKEAKPRWNFIAFLFMVMVIVILVGGSLWIMYHLTERTMSETEMTNYMLRQAGVQK